jgi:2-keto-3-deoxy-L-rhamnonate aldolase RhmA|tara:strand:+ start:410 stop:625 length:216 start_codon:yes stop_codon:yes gene_type:complete
MQLLDTPNPNAKKILIDSNVENQQSLVTDELNKIEGVSSVFFGPGFVTITKDENVQWEMLNQNIINIFDKL